jgi:hypothetical protein
MTLKLPAGPRFPPRDPPEGGAAAFAQRGISTGAYTYRARVRLNAPAAEVAEWVTPTTGTIEPLDEQSCILETGANSLDALGVWMGAFGVEFAVLEPPELVEHLHVLAARFTRAAGARPDS